MLQDLGYTTVRYYRGGLEDWEQHGGRFASLTETLESSSASGAAGRQDTIESIGQLASEFCADCIPSRHARALRSWTEDIERTARRLV